MNQAVCEKYPEEAIFDKNSLGAAPNKSQFIGRISAIYFLKTVNVNSVHKSLNKIFKVLDITHLLSFALTGKDIYFNSPMLCEAFDFEELSKTLRHTFLSAIPNEYVNSTEMHELGINNAKIINNKLVSDIFGNVKGVEGLLVLIEKMEEVSNPLHIGVLEKVLEIVIDFALIDIQKTKFFFNKGLLILGYSLEKLSTKINFTMHIFDLLQKLMEVIRKYYNMYYIKYLEAVFYNPRIWMNVDKAIYDKVLEFIQESALKDSTKKNPYYLGILLNFIEVFSNEEHILESYLRDLKKAIHIVYQANITKQSLSLLFSFANGLNLRNKKGQFVQSFNVLSIFFKLYTESIFLE